MSIVRVKRSFMWSVDGGTPRMFKTGRLMDSTDPAVAANPARFEAVDDLVAASSPVERATAGPGEKRSVDLTGSDAKAEPEPKAEPKAKVEEKPRSARVTTTTGAKGKQDGEV